MNRLTWRGTLWTTARSSWSRRGCAIFWRWSTPGRSQSGGRTEERERDETGLNALRDDDPAGAVHLGGTGRRHEKVRPRAADVRSDLVWLFPGHDLRPGLADVPRPSLSHSQVQLGGRCGVLHGAGFRPCAYARGSLTRAS